MFRRYIQWVTLFMPEQSDRQLTYIGAINEALEFCLQSDPSVLVIGEGVPDPKGIFGSTVGLQEKFGKHRIFDMPLAENGMTGICIGAALTGMRPVMIHQRIDFILLALDQIINNAAKWHYMFNGQVSVPMVIRLIIGRGWGQGPQHSQSLQAIFGQIPGLKVVMPTTPHDAKGMMISAIQDNNPVIFIEHRWLHNLQDHVPKPPYTVDLNQSQILRTGRHVTICAFSYMVIEAIKVADLLKEHGIEIEVIDLRAIRPLDMKNVISSVTKTGHIIVIDNANKTGGMGAEILALLAESAFSYLTKPPVRLAFPDHPVPTTRFLADEYYIEAPDVANSVFQLLNFTNQEVIDKVISQLTRPSPRDIPDRQFTGPF